LVRPGHHGVLVDGQARRRIACAVTIRGQCHKVRNWRVRDGLAIRLLPACLTQPLIQEDPQVRPRGRLPKPNLHGGCVNADTHRSGRHRDVRARSYHAGGG
jgi:hypothetical protein